MFVLDSLSSLVGAVKRKKHGVFSLEECTRKGRRCKIIIFQNYIAILEGISTIHGMYHDTRACLQTANNAAVFYKNQLSPVFCL